MCSHVFWEGLPVVATLMEPKGACIPAWTRTFHKGSHVASLPPGVEVERREVKRGARRQPFARLLCPLDVTFPGAE